MDHLARASQPVISLGAILINQPLSLNLASQNIEIVMNVFYFEIENLRTSPTTVVIFADSAENASAISGRLMHSIDQYAQPYKGRGLALFRKSGKPEQLVEALASATHEGLAGYTPEGGWRVVNVP